MAYITFDEMQQILTSQIRQGKEPLDYPDACQVAVKLGIIHPETPVYPRDRLLQIPKDEAFQAYLHQMPLGVIGQPPIWPGHDQKNDTIRVFQHLYNPNSVDHVFQRFVLYYAFMGEFSLQFEHKNYQMEAGDIVVIAPGCRVIAYMPESSIVIGMNIEPKEFEQLFYSAMSESNVVSRFLHSVLYSNDPANYLLFHTDNDEILKSCIKMLMLQNTAHDKYTDITKRRILGMMLSHLMRHYQTRISYHHSIHQGNFPEVLEYIQNHWKHLTLTKLAERFHYHPAYLSGLIRRHTGKTFKDLVLEIRMLEAEHRLLHTDDKVTDIAYAIGYHSPEHFSRQFRTLHGISPDAYRKQSEKTSMT